jgi:hypothetical protein
MVKGYELDVRDSIPGSDKPFIFLFRMQSRPTLGPTQPAIQLVPGSFPGVKVAGGEANNSPPFSTDVKN